MDTDIWFFIIFFSSNDRNDKSNSITNSDTQIKLNPDCPKGEGDRVANIKDKVRFLCMMYVPI